MRKKLITCMCILISVNLIFLSNSYSFVTTGQNIFLAGYSIGNKIVGAHDEDLKKLAEKFKESFGYTGDTVTEKMKFITTIECKNNKGTKIKIGTGKYAETLKIKSDDIKNIYGYPYSDIKSRRKLASSFDR